MPSLLQSSQRSLLLMLAGACVLAIILFSSFSSSATYAIHSSIKADSSTTTNLRPEILHGHAIAPKLGNATIKAELGRAAWRLFHTTMAQFPEKPTEDESTALRTYIYLFQRLYPCGECAEHFGQIIKQYPPQVSSRNTAAGWACHVHNKVNESLKKELFDCSKLGDFYDCGCADEKKKGA